MKFQILNFLHQSKEKNKSLNRNQICITSQQVNNLCTETKYTIKHGESQIKGINVRSLLQIKSVYFLVVNSTECGCSYADSKSNKNMLMTSKDVINEFKSSLMQLNDAKRRLKTAQSTRKRPSKLSDCKLKFQISIFTLLHISLYPSHSFSQLQKCPKTILHLPFSSPPPTKSSKKESHLYSGPALRLSSACLSPESELAQSRISLKSETKIWPSAWTTKKVRCSIYF